MVKKLLWLTLMVVQDVLFTSTHVIIQICTVGWDLWMCHTIMTAHPFQIPLLYWKLRFKEALRRDPSLQTGDLQRGYDLDCRPMAISLATANATPMSKLPKKIFQCGWFWTNHIKFHDCPFWKTILRKKSIMLIKYTSVLRTNCGYFMPPVRIRGILSLSKSLNVESSWPRWWCVWWQRGSTLNVM